MTLDPEFHFLEVAYPYVARRLLTDEDPQLRDRLFQVRMLCSKYRCFLPGTDALFQVQMRTHNLGTLVSGTDALFRVQVLSTRYRCFVPGTDAF